MIEILTSENWVKDSYVYRRLHVNQEIEIFPNRLKAKITKLNMSEWTIEDAKIYSDPFMYKPLDFYERTMLPEIYELFKLDIYMIDSGYKILQDEMISKLEEILKIKEENESNK